MEASKYKFKVRHEKLIADTVTPVSVYLRIRDRFPCSLLLESADYRGSENSFSFICFDPVAGFKVDKEIISQFFPGRPLFQTPVSDRSDVIKGLEQFVSSFGQSGGVLDGVSSPGVFGYTAYDAIRYFEDITLKAAADSERAIPDINYNFYRYIIAFNHFRNEAFIVQNVFEGEEAEEDSLRSIKDLIKYAPAQAFPFTAKGEEVSNFDDKSQIEAIAFCKQHIARGDVFQIVPSRRFSQQFEGDEFNVYRALRSINPSPYLFFFDYGHFKIFGSSPEAQLVVKNGVATIYPIAGTYPRRADRSNDLELAESLKSDPKENAEHVMLVDLARNDLSRHCSDVHVENYKEVQFYSHVIHLVSKVSGKVKPGKSSVSVLADTFPAGTLSGAPKYRAIELIDRYERGRRGYYGGCLGFFGLNGDCNQAIMIRSFLSRNGRLFYQAGAGIVFDSDPESEVREVRNKLGALKKAIEAAQGEML